MSEIVHEPGDSRSSADGAAGSPSRGAASDTTRDEILAAARQIFSESGLSGARVDDIALHAGKSKRMIYYYFRSKEALFRAVLLDVYVALREAESSLQLDRLEPLEALAAMVRFTFDYQHAHETFVRLVMAENVNMGRSLDLEPELIAVNRNAAGQLEEICRRGIEKGVIRRDLAARDLLLTINSLSFFTASNRYTLSKIFSRDFSSRRVLRRRREVVVATVLRWAATPRALAAGLAGEA